MRAHVVVDLGFGDAGKGLVVDHLVRRTGAPLVVRYNGGAQAGHNVVTPDGRHHTFAQLGAGTFAGAKTWLSRHVIVHPTALVAEARALEEKGVSGPLATVEVSDRARVVTPFHQALNRLRELARGDARHGSCGAGIGECVADALRHPDDVVTAADLRAPPGVLAPKIERVRARLIGEARALAARAREAPGAASV
ncbi:adenylosuccinate synthetase, partial [Myxococcota bacterium]|nr:adenylosuccinate synthetase [Myxococcota bacterium]